MAFFITSRCIEGLDSPSTEIRYFNDSAAPVRVWLPIIAVLFCQWELTIRVVPVLLVPAGDRLALQLAWVCQSLRHREYCSTLGMYCSGLSCLLPHTIDFGMSTPLTTVIVAGMFLLLMMRSASEIFSVQFSLYS